MKEQTPITAKTILEKEFEDYIYLDGFEIDSIFCSMEQYAQYREKRAVLEALEEVKEEIGATVFPLKDNIKWKKVEFVLDKHIENTTKQN